MSTTPLSQASPPANLQSLWLRCALFVSACGAVGSLYMSLEMDLKACSLCLYQRAFIMATAAILGLGLFMRGVPSAALTPLALASTSAGACIAGFHLYLDRMEILECPAGITGRITAPGESLAMYVLLVLMLLGDLFRQGMYVTHGLGAMLVGFVFAVTSIRATPPPPTPDRPYTKELDGCRKVYREMVSEPRTK